MVINIYKFVSPIGKQITGYFLIFCMSAINGCTYLNRNQDGMAAIWDHYSKDNNKLVIFLPGIRGESEDFIQNRFFQTARDYDLNHDLAAINSDIKHSIDGSFVKRLKKEVIEPAKAEGYDSIWLVGISLGGYDSMKYYATYPNDIEGVILLSPYPGIDEEINAMGTRFKTVMKMIVAVDKDYIPFSLLEIARKLQAHNKLDNVFLSYGNKDKFATIYPNFIKLLPPGNVHMIKGNHDWTTWENIWEDILQKRYISGLTGPEKVK